MTKFESEAHFAPLVGEWEFAMTQGGRVVATGRTTFTLDGAFLRQVADTTPAEDAPDGWHTNAPRQTTAVIGVDGANGDMTMLYADSRGVARLYQMSLSETEWRLWRDAPGFNQRFIGRFEDGGRTIVGHWEASTEGDLWELDFEGTYRKVGDGQPQDTTSSAM